MRTNRASGRLRRHAHHRAEPSLAEEANPAQEERPGPKVRPIRRSCGGGVAADPAVLAGCLETLLRLFISRISRRSIRQLPPRQDQMNELIPYSIVVREGPRIIQLMYQCFESSQMKSNLMLGVKNEKVMTSE